MLRLSIHNKVNTKADIGEETKNSKVTILVSFVIYSASYRDVKVARCNETTGVSSARSEIDGILRTNI
jgi:hypothetical protein